jgi:Uma2 family endonuclease
MVTSRVTMKRVKDRYTYKDYLLLPEDKRYEILDGDLFMVPSPGIRHQQISRRLLVALTLHVERDSLGEVLSAPCDVILSEESVVQPDILFVRKERMGVIGEMNLRGAPDLVVEILSQGTRVKDLELKRKIYARYGVREYWVVDPDAGTVDVLVRSGEVYTSAGTFGKSSRLSSPLFPELNLLLSTIFRD